jgi:hypothetical protein
MAQNTDTQVRANRFGSRHKIAGRLTNIRAPAFPIGVPTPPLLAVLTGCRNSRTARTLRRVSVLCSPASSSRYRWLNPLGNHRECGRPPMRRVSVLCSAPSSSHCRGANRGFSRLGQSAEPTLLSLLWYKAGVRLPTRVANMVQTRGETLAGKPVDVSVSMG